jgi:Fungal N-terminal domain of STAND proteins
MTDPASLACGVLGTIGVVLDASITTYTFVSSIKGAPRSLESLASHIFTLESVLSALKELTSQPHVRQRSQRPEALKCLQSALSGCDQVLSELDTELRSYVRHQPASG